MFKNVFEEKLGSQKMKYQILKKYERKGEKMSKIIKYALPICLIICGSLIFSNYTKLNKNTTPSSETIIINKINDLGITKLDADIKTTTYNNSNLKNIINGELSLPSDITKADYYGIYTKKINTNDYNILNCLVNDYYNEENTKNIKIAFSNKNKPIRDYHFEEKDSKISKINNKELKIYKYNETYYVEFTYNNYNFDIETNNITEKELTNLLQSIIK